MYPYSPEVTHTIKFNVARFPTTLPTYLWWVPTPTTAGDQPFKAVDALSIAHHELAHALGFADQVFLNDIFTGSQSDKWTTPITGTTFDPGGLNVMMAGPGNLGHLADNGSTAGDLMVPAISNSFRRGISQIDVAMLALAYGYTIPEPAAVTLLTLSVLVASTRRQRGFFVLLRRGVDSQRC